jgi:HEAT repeat protein
VPKRYLVRLGEEPRARLLLPELARVTQDKDAGCRAAGLGALSRVALYHGSNEQKARALRVVLAAMHDREESVRLVAVGSLGHLDSGGVPAPLEALGKGLDDRSVDVRSRAALELGLFGMRHPTRQSEVASLLIPLLLARDAPGVRTIAIQTMCRFRADVRPRSPRPGPDVADALIAPLRDPEPRVRWSAAGALEYAALRPVERDLEFAKGPDDSRSARGAE